VLSGALRSVLLPGGTFRPRDAAHCYEKREGGVVKRGEGALVLGGGGVGGGGGGVGWGGGGGSKGGGWRG